MSVLIGDTELRNAVSLVLYDEAVGSYRSQLLATGIRGPQFGERLAILPSLVTTWGERRIGPRPEPRNRTPTPKPQRPS